MSQQESIKQTKLQARAIAIVNSFQSVLTVSEYVHFMNKATRLGFSSEGVTESIEETLFGKKVLDDIQQAMFRRQVEMQVHCTDAMLPAKVHFLNVILPQRMAVVDEYEIKDFMEAFENFQIEFGYRTKEGR